MRMLIAAVLIIGLGVGVAAAQNGSRPSAEATLASAPVNLNTATMAQLETLPGIGRLRRSGSWTTASRMADSRGSKT